VKKKKVNKPKARAVEPEIPLPLPFFGIMKYRWVRNYLQADYLRATFLVAEAFPGYHIRKDRSDKGTKKKDLLTPAEKRIKDAQTNLSLTEGDGLS